MNAILKVLFQLIEHYNFHCNSDEDKNIEEEEAVENNDDEEVFDESDDNSSSAFYTKRLRKYRKMALQALNHALKRFSHSHLFDEKVLKSGMETAILPIIKSFKISSMGTKSAAIIDVIHTVMTFRGLTDSYFEVDMMRLLVDIITTQNSLKPMAIKCILDYCSGVDHTPKGSLDMDTHNAEEHKNVDFIQSFQSKLIPYFKSVLADSKLQDNELEILQLLKGSVVDLEIARMLLLQVKNSRKDQFHVKGEDILLNTIAGMIDDSDESVAEFFVEFIKLLAKIRSQSGKNALVSCFESLFSKRDPDLLNMLKDLNSFSKKYVNEVDFERRLIAYKSLNDNFENLTPKVIDVCIAQCTIEVKQTDDLSIRSAVTSLMNKLVDSGKINDETLIMNARDVMKGTVSPGYFSNEDTGSTSHLIRNGKVLKDRSKNNDNTSIVNNWPIPALNNSKTIYLKLIRNISEFKNVPIPDDDVENDPVLNLFHIQIHRRNKAIDKISEFLESGSSFSPNFIENFIIPVCEATLCDSGNKEQNYLQNSAVKLFGLAASKLPWNRYKTILLKLIQLSIKLSDKCQQNQFGFKASLDKLASRLVSETLISCLGSNMEELAKNESDTKTFIIPKLQTQ